MDAREVIAIQTADDRKEIADIIYNNIEPDAGKLPDLERSIAGLAERIATVEDLIQSGIRRRYGKNEFCLKSSD